MMKKVAVIISSILFAGAVTAATAMADTNDSEIDANMLSKSSITIDQAIAIAVAGLSTPGSVSKAELESENNVLTWQVEVITPNNKTFDISVNAKTGNVIQQKEDMADKNANNDDQGDDENEDNDRETND